MKTISKVNPMPEIEACGLGAPAYTNAAVGSAVGRCRRKDSDCPIYRVTAILERTGKRFGYDLPLYDAENMARELAWNKGYQDITLFRVR